jgi:two-component system chemotaxis response regulator CheB
MTGDPPDGHHELVVIGASAGGVAALPRLIRGLPADLPAAIAIVQHMAATSYMHLVDIIQRTTSLPVQWAEHGDDVVRGRVLVAPPGIHMLLADHKVVLAGGPRENRARPSINRLFRSAARSFDSRTIGVLLTGMLDDGVAGLDAIRKSGGVTIVQDPAEAEYESMPKAALAAGVTDHVSRIDEMGALITRLVREPALHKRVPDDVRLQAALDVESIARPESFNGYEQSSVTCPECGGPMWEVGEAAVQQYRCFLGHAETAASLLDSQGIEVERALWAAVRALQDRALTYEKLCRDAKRLGTPRSAAIYETRAVEAREQAERARDFLVQLQRQLGATAADED